MSVCVCVRACVRVVASTGSLIWYHAICSLVEILRVENELRLRLGVSGGPVDVSSPFPTQSRGGGRREPKGKRSGRR